MGYYCDGSDVTSIGSICPAGRYCPLGTRYADEYPCPVGTFSSSTGNYQPADCEDCTPGKYCQFKGQTSAYSNLLAGYHGNNEAGHKIPDPYKCPQTAYCDAGSAAPTGCPDGQWTPSRGAQSIADCIPCERGKWCKFATMWSDTSSTAGINF